MNGDAIFVLLASVFALSAALLTWLAVDLGTTTLTRYRETFTERTRFQVQEFFLFIDPRKVFAANIATMVMGAMGVWLVSGSALLGPSPARRRPCCRGCCTAGCACAAFSSSRNSCPTP